MPHAPNTEHHKPPVSIPAVKSGWTSLPWQTVDLFKGEGMRYLSREPRRASCHTLDNSCGSPVSTTDLQMLPERRHIWFEERHVMSFASSRWLADAPMNAVWTCQPNDQQSHSPNAFPGPFPFPSISLHGHQICPGDLHARNHDPFPCPYPGRGVCLRIP